MRMKHLDLSMSELYCVQSSMKDALLKWRGMMDCDNASDSEIVDEIVGIIKQVDEVIADQEGLATALCTLYQHPREPRVTA